MPSRPPAAPPGPTYPIARLAGTVHRHVPRSSAALNPTTSRLARRWPVLLLLAVPVLLPVGRTAELPLVVGAAPFYARLVETSLREVDRGVIEATLAMGASTWQLVWRVLLPEARPGLVAGATVTTIALVGFTAMGGTIGSGGLGDLAFRDGYQRSHTDVAVATVVLLLLLVQAVQVIGDRLVAHYSRR